MVARTVRYGTVLLSIVLMAAPSMVFSDPDVLRTHPGDNITLSCQVGGNVSIRAVEWTRPDLEPKSVLYFSDGHSDPTNQHSSFKDRVELVDRELKSGNVSLILRNVSINDSGTYECRVAFGGSGRTKRGDIDGDPIKKITLEVTDSGFKNEDTNPTNRPQTITTTTDGPQIITTPTDGNNNNHVGWAVGLPVCLVVFALVVVVGVCMYKKHKDKQSEEPAADEAVGDQLL